MRLARRLLSTCCYAALVVVAVGWSEAPAADYFLVIGGGPRATNNQVSLEKNVHYLQRILETAGVPLDRQIYLFADGTDPDRDIHEIDPALDQAKPYVLLARLTGTTRYFDFRFRSSHIPNVRGAATRQNVEATLRELAGKTQEGDRVFVYITGHGGKGNPTSNGRFYLWNNASMTVREFAEELARFKEGVKVVAVMVQCYSGSFANMIFEGGNPENDVYRGLRAGFFATVETRGAAGCTPDIEEENYREYSSYFWAALFGRTRTGRKVEAPDYDGDGTVSLDEAHAYVLIEGDTIDIPVKTSEAFLRRFSPKKVDGAYTLEQPYEELLKLAGPIERTVLERIREQFNLAGSNCIEQARNLAKKLQAEQRRLQGEANRHMQLARMHGRRILEAAMKHWPELRNPWRPDAHALLAREGNEITRFIEKSAPYASFSGAWQKAEELREEALARERAWARVQRFLRTAENVVLEANLRKFGAPDLVARYDELRTLEHEPFLVFPGEAGTSEQASAKPAPGEAVSTSVERGCR